MTNCERKLRRADAQLTDLKALIVNHLDDPQRLVVEHEVNGREVIFKVAEIVPPPVAISLVAGEILHNFRCVLDYLVWGMIEKAGHDPTTTNQFPVYAVQPSAGVGANKRLLNAPGPEIALIDALQPYHSGKPKEHPLWHLNEFNNIDKHRFLHVADESTFKSGKLVAGGEYQLSNILQTRALERGATLLVVTAVNATEPDDLRIYAHVGTDVSFRLEVRDKRDPLDQTPALIVPVFNGLLRIRSYLHEDVLGQQGLGGASGWNPSAPFEAIHRTSMSARSFGKKDRAGLGFDFGGAH